MEGGEVLLIREVSGVEWNERMREKEKEKEKRVSQGCG
jgi:hypothetical protein